MVKTSREQTEADEKKVIRELQKNSKESVDVIAKGCGFSRQKVWRIIKRLEKNKTIWGYHAVVDNEKLGRKRYFIFLKRTFKPVTEDNINIVLRRGLKEVAAKLGVDIKSSFYVHGFADWLICITADHITQVKKFCDLFNTLFEEGYVSDIQILDVIFPITYCGFDNPNIDELKDFFITR